MTDRQISDYDESGKLVMDMIYNKPEPVAYFNFLRRLDYAIPQHAKPVFMRLIEAYGALKGKEHLKLIDLGCSYGVNAALIKYGFELDELYELYDKRNVAGMTANELAERDREVFASAETGPSLSIVGIDVAENALDYARKASLIDAMVAGDFEVEEPSPAQHAALSEADLVISTGCIGYVTEQSLGRILAPPGDAGRPWLANFVLRMFPFEPIQKHLAGLGYVTATAEVTFPQRRFASDAEQEQVLDRLMALGVDPSGRESEGWLHANFYLSRPVEDIALAPVTELIEADTLHGLR